MKRSTLCGLVMSALLGTAQPALADEVCTEDYQETLRRLHTKSYKGVIIVGSNLDQCTEGIQALSENLKTSSVPVFVPKAPQTVPRIRLYSFRDNQGQYQLVPVDGDATVLMQGNQIPENLCLPDLKTHSDRYNLTKINVIVVYCGKAPQIQNPCFEGEVDYIALEPSSSRLNTNEVALQLLRSRPVSLLYNIEYRIADIHHGTTCKAFSDAYQQQLIELNKPEEQK